MVDRKAVWEIHVWAQEEFGVIFERDVLVEWFDMADIKPWGHPKDVVRVNALRRTKCPVSPLELWDMYQKLTSKEIALQIGNVCRESVDDWLKKSGVILRDHRRSNKDFPRSHRITHREILSERLKLAHAEGKIPKTSHQQLLEMNKKAVAALRANCEARKVVLHCKNCSSEVKRTQGEINKALRNHHDGAFCSRRCATIFRNQQREMSIKMTGLHCPHCKSNFIIRAGEERGRQAFRCKDCGKSTRKPIIELGLRQDLEAAGALDDGRILTSAFLTEKQASSGQEESELVGASSGA
jgi:hypothetical protein